MLRLTLRSLLILLGSALAGSLVIFLLLRMLRGDIAAVLLGQHATPEALEALREQLGLNRSWTVQYLDWLTGLVQGDLGRSYAGKYDIFQQIQTRFGVTTSLAIASLIISWIIALIAGTYSALHVRNLRGGFVDVVAQLGIAVPAFWAGLLLVLFFSIRLGWFPAGGYMRWGESPIGAIRTLTLPVIAMSISLAAINTRYVRSAMLEVLNEDYIRTAMAKGRTLRRAAMVHGIRNASVVLVTVGALQLGALMAGAVVIENVFVLPGLGRMLVEAVGAREVIVVQSLAFVILLLILVLNFIMDIAYGLIDPRIRDAKERIADG